MLSIQKAGTAQSTIVLDRNITDLLKFVACIMVAMSHYSGYALAEGVSSSVIYKVIAATGGYLGVAVFFFLSSCGGGGADASAARFSCIFASARFLLALAAFRRCCFILILLSIVPFTHTRAHAQRRSLTLAHLNSNKAKWKPKKRQKTKKNRAVVTSF